MRESKQRDAWTDRLINSGESDAESDRPWSPSSNERHHQKNLGLKAHTGNLTPCRDYIKTTLKNNTVAKSSQKMPKFWWNPPCAMCHQPAPCSDAAPSCFNTRCFFHGTLNLSSTQFDLEKNKNKGGKQKISSSQTDLARAAAGWSGHWFCNVCALSFFLI